MAAGLSRIRDIFRFYSRIFCFAAEEFVAAWLRKTGAYGCRGNVFPCSRELESLPGGAFPHRGKFRLLR
ncbi:hypothetical protein CXT96_02805 [Akkermansia muciniphila]|nr:hypothetical protein CXT92_04115 [Akkermansia muciniphila]PNC90893.1 hypothetical protein CXT91_08640 [Akkermansia muciniphila]PND15877.1 hypothetical protein CXT96_02805 [Akkermansia muciniphila]